MSSASLIQEETGSSGDRPSASGSGENAERQKELFAKLQVGDTVEGTVKNVTDFGAFIDLGGIDGLLHISEMSWGRVENPKKVIPGRRDD